MPEGVAIVCEECGKDAPRGNDDPRPHGGYPTGSMEAVAWVTLNHAPKQLCEPCFNKVIATPTE